MKRELKDFSGVSFSYFLFRLCVNNIKITNTCYLLCQGLLIFRVINLSSDTTFFCSDFNHLSDYGTITMSYISILQNVQLLHTYIIKGIILIL